MDLSVFSKENNFRELGGYPTKDGRTVKHGMFYRSGALGNMTPEELSEVEKLGIRCIFDFRSQHEVERKPDPEIKGARYFHVSAVTDEAGNEVDLSPKGMEQSEEVYYSMQGHEVFLENFYGRMPFSPAYTVMFKEIQSGKTPILFHCSAGKDRTGIAAALILLMLGADEQTIMEDYLKTNEYRRTLIENLKISKQDIIARYPDAGFIIQGFEGVNQEAAEFTLQKIKDRYGSYATYFRQKFHLGEEEIAYLRNKYTEKK